MIDPDRARQLKRAREWALQRRRKRRREYEFAATAISDGDADLAEVHVDVAGIILEDDLEKTGGRRLSPDEPRPVDVDIPPLTALEGEKLIAMASDLLETVEKDPVVVPADHGAGVRGETDAR